jgi:hypothetical protein
MSAIDLTAAKAMLPLPVHIGLVFATLCSRRLFQPI